MAHNKQRYMQIYSYIDLICSHDAGKSFKNGRVGGWEKNNNFKVAHLITSETRWKDWPIRGKIWLLVREKKIIKSLNVEAWLL